MSLVSLEAAKDHLQINTPIGSPLDPVDRDITRKLAQAEDIILDYLKVAGSPPEWTEETLPPLVQAAILLQLAELFGFRGDDPASTSTSAAVVDGQLSPTITNLLRRYRDPALA